MSLLGAKMVRSAWAAFCVALFFHALAACADAPTSPYKHVILISLDTTRADYLGCYGNTEIQTPNIDRLAAQGVVFRQAMAAAPTTLASHTSLMTGLYPHSHGIVRNGFNVAPANEMLAETLKRRGFTTAAFLGSAALDGRFGFDQGFDAFDDDFDIDRTPTKFDQHQRRAAGVTDAALRFLEKSSAERLFLFVHYFDAHAPYDPPPPFDRQYGRPDGPREAIPRDFEHSVRAHQERTVGQSVGLEGVIRAGLTVDLVRRADGVALPEDHDLEALYRGEISYIDRELGRLLDALRAKRILDHALVVLTSDHGETFAEHGDYWNHGLWVYDTTVHVPLVFVPAPAGAPASIDTPVSNVDVAPTILEMLGIAPEASVDGRSLTPLFRERSLEPRPSFSEATLPPRLEDKDKLKWGNALKPKCVRLGSWKYIHAPYLELEELYDLEHDPEERHNLLVLDAAHALPDAAAKARELRAELSRWSASARPRPSAQVRKSREQQQQENEMLKALGYPGVGDEDEPAREAEPKK